MTEAASHATTSHQPSELRALLRSDCFATGSTTSGGLSAVGEGTGGVGASRVLGRAARRAEILPVLTRRLTSRTHTLRSASTTVCYCFYCM